MRARVGRLQAMLLVLVVAGCSSSPAPAPTSVNPTVAALQRCQDAADILVDAAARTVAAYEQPIGQATASQPATSDASSITPSDALSAAITSARTTIQNDHCDVAAFRTRLSDQLATLKTASPLSAAVLARLTATLTGRSGSSPIQLRLHPGDDLAKAVAEAPTGSTLTLAAGSYALASPVVVLDAVTIVGDGSVTVSSTAPDAAILILAQGRVELRGLVLKLAPKPAASGIVAGSAASLVLNRVTISGARKAADGGGAGGAGVLMSGQGTAGSGRGTTLEVTDSAFVDNGWSGLAVTGGHRVSVVRATFDHNGQCGACFLDATDGSISASTFTGNGVGVGAGGASKPTIVDVTITGGTVGVQLDGTAAPKLERTRVTGATRAGIIVSGKVTGYLGHTTCAKVPYGIVVADTAAPTLVANACTVARGG